MKLNPRIEWFQLTVIAAMFIAAALVWPHAPQRMPVHWNWQGDPDRYGGKFAGLLLLPLTTLGLYVLLLLLPRIDPGYRNYQNFARAYQVIRVGLVLFLAGVYAITVLAALGVPIDVGATIAVAVGALLAVLGNFMGKIRPNWFVGVRTPWTLSSKLSWTKTHRQAGWLLIVLGVLIALTGIVRAEWLAVVTAAYGIGSLVWLVVYSYLVFRRDPNRISPAGTTPENSGSA